ncbi:MAG: monovalent cation:proton antiporter-2 (CPA2) family protein [Betaproteobacteria bacterium]|nr:monovalent cation:proton antiporter-2 (CPA2) family protein [Betaproteobacteria bacterium]MDE2621787.1 monovalent cation:proton antiporter-2 (CPA2) family protein [Betaproteobacteria bacterium]
MNDTLELVLVLLLSATLTVSLFRRLRLPAMLGYLLAGILIGPHASGFIPPDDGTRSLAEFGIVFLMFTVGLEFSLGQLMAMRRTVFGLGGAQMVVTLLAGFALARAAGVNWQGSVALAGALSLSSTAIVSRLLSERLELKSSHGQRIMGVMLFQDLAVVPLLILIPELSRPDGGLVHALGFAALKAVLVLALLLGFGKGFMRRWFNWVARQKSSEVFVLNVFLVTLALAWLTHRAGLSLALGAFVAGVLISETDYRYQVEDYIKPFRDVLLGLFFISIGTLLDLSVVGSQFPWVLAVLVGLLLLKLAIVYGLARAFGDIDSVSLRTALAVAPAGEFGFVLLAQAEGVHLLPEAALQVVLAAMLVSMLLSPLIMMMSDRIVMYCCESEWTLRSLALHELSARSYGAHKHVIVCGYGRSGQNLARFLEQEGLTVIALDMDPQRVRAAAVAGESVVFGDAGRREVLVAAGLHRAAAVVVTFADTSVSLAIISHVRELEPGLPVIVRTFDDADLDLLKDAGAAEVVPEILEGSLMLASHAMLELGVPLARVLKRIRQVRSERYHLMRGFFRGTTDETSESAEQSQPRMHSVVINEGAYANGRMIQELMLDHLGVEVTAIRRHGIRGLKPSAETRLIPMDVVVLMGIPEALAQAESRLLQG